MTLLYCSRMWVFVIGVPSFSTPSKCVHFIFFAFLVSSIYLISLYFVWFCFVLFFFHSRSTPEGNAYRFWYIIHMRTKERLTNTRNTHNNNKIETKNNNNFEINFYYRSYAFRFVLFCSFVHWIHTTHTYIYAQCTTPIIKPANSFIKFVSEHILPFSYTQTHTHTALYTLIYIYICIVYPHAYAHVSTKDLWMESNSK